MSSVSNLDDTTTPSLDEMGAIWAQLTLADHRALADFAQFLIDEQNGEAP